MAINRRNQIVAFVVGMAVTTAAHADYSVTQTFGELSATVTFEQVGDNLQVTLENISTFDVLCPSDLLTGVFFNISGATLFRERAVLTTGSYIEFAGAADQDQDPANPIGIVGDGLGLDNGFGYELGGEWGYRSDLAPGLIPTGATHVIASAGLDDLVGPFDRFPGEDLDSPDAPDGMNYGILSAGDDFTSGNAPVTGDEPLIKNGVILTFSGLPGSFNVDTDISDVAFNYGTALNVVPAPPAILLAFAGLGLVGILRRRLG